ncbi:unnamed protein product [marine sediment metagenome]|uniref:Uncharacterized protein n=1 Tax=marine sediment metagenome TaxID=412755 RepID=X1KLI5_9ZZZZ
MAKKEKQQIHCFAVAIPSEEVAAEATYNDIREIRNTLTDMYIMAVDFKTTPTIATFTDLLLAEQGEAIFSGTFTEASGMGVIATSYNMGEVNGSGYGAAPLAVRVELPSGTYYYLEKGERIYFHGKHRNTSATIAYNMASVAFIYYTTENPY